MKAKGQMENRVKAANFPFSSIFQTVWCEESTVCSLLLSVSASLRQCSSINHAHGKRLLHSVLPWPASPLLSAMHPNINVS
ncbi:unnamed protein product [Chrysoparadoxa australica]